VKTGDRRQVQGQGDAENTSEANKGIMLTNNFQAPTKNEYF
jgi:hypothetical protein